MVSSIDRKSELIHALEDIGCRVTGPRIEIIQEISSVDGSFSAEDINLRLPDLGRATIFRTIKLLHETQKLCKTVLFDGTIRYSLDNGFHHHHLICVKCGDIEEMRSMELERVLRAASKKIPDPVVGHSLEIYRICRNCK